MRKSRMLASSLALTLSLLCCVSAGAMEVPTDSTVQNLNGVQQYIKTYTVSPELDPASLIEEPFRYEDYKYSYSSMTKQENSFADKKERTEVVTVETDKKDLDAVLDALAPSIEYDDGQYSGVLNLDHTTIKTEAAGYASRSYTVTETKEIGNLDSNDMAYVPATTVKNGMTLPLSSVDWQVQGTALVDDLLTPSAFKAIATYSGKAHYSAATGYISTAEYTGEVSCDEIESVTYTVTYVGDRSNVLSAVGNGIAEHPVASAGGLLGAAALATGGVLLVRHKRRQEVEAVEEIPEETEVNENEA